MPIPYGYPSRKLVLCVAAKEATRNVSLYMAALYKRFFQVPDFTELEEEIEQSRQEVQDCLGQSERRKLMQLVDAQNLLRERISLASFIARFKLAQEIAKELGVTPHGKETS